MSTPSRTDVQQATVRELVKDWIGILQGVATIAGIGAAAWWFFFQGESRSKVNLEITGYHRQLEAKTTLLSVSVKATNVGKRPTEITKGGVVISQVAPLPTPDSLKQNAKDANGKDLGVLAWKGIGERDVPYPMVLAPGEFDSYHFDFLVPANIKAARIYAELRDPSRKGQTWATVVFHDMDAPSAGNPKLANKR